MAYGSRKGSYGGTEKLLSARSKDVFCVSSSFVEQARERVLRLDQIFDCVLPRIQNRIEIPFTHSS